MNRPTDYFRTLIDPVGAGLCSARVPVLASPVKGHPRVASLAASRQFTFRGTTLRRWWDSPSSPAGRTTPRCHSERSEESHPRLNIAKTPHLFRDAGFCVGIDLSSRLVTKQVFSALVSLTSVFGMGTGGPSPLKTPTIQGLRPEN